MILRKTDIGGFFAERVRFILFSGFFRWLLCNGLIFARLIMQSLKWCLSRMGTGVFFKPTMPLVGIAVFLSAVFSSIRPSAAVETVSDTDVSFVAGFEDLPLMPGLTQEPQGVTQFDSPYGTLVETQASGPVSLSEAQAFYAETLPQLGWVPTDRAVYHRENIRLLIEITERAGGGNDPFPKGAILLKHDGGTYPVTYTVDRVIVQTIFGI